MNDILAAFFSLTDNVALPEGSLPFHEFGAEDSFTCPKCGRRAAFETIEAVGSRIHLCWCPDHTKCSYVFLASAEED
jgi:hypothetical protein